MREGEETGGEGSWDGGGERYREKEGGGERVGVGRREGGVSVGIGREEEALYE